MRYTYLLLLSLIACPTWAQQLYSLQQGYQNQAQGLVVVDSHLLVYGSFQNADQFRTTTLLRIDTLGDSIVMHPVLVQNGEEMGFNNSRSWKGNRLFLSHRDACLNRDNLSLGNQIYALNQKQEVLWKSPVILFSFLPFQPFSSLTPVVNDTIVLANANELVTYDLGTRKALHTTNGLGDLQHIIPLTDTSFTAIDGRHFFTYNIECEVVFTNLLDYKPLDFSWRDPSKNSYLSIGPQRVSALNDKGVTVISYGWEGFENDFDSLHRIHWLRDSLFVSGYQGGNWKLGYVNRFFEVDTSIVLGPAEYHLKDLQWSGEDIYYLLSDTNKQHDLIGRTQFSPFFSPTLPDIALNTLKLDSIIPNYNQNNLLNPVFELSFSVTNEGNSPISSFYLNWKSLEDSSCNAARFSKLIRKQLSPNQSTTLRLSINDTLLEPESTYPLCITVSSPDGFLDRNINNDSACILITLPKTGISELTFKLPAVPSVIKAGKEISLPENVRFTALYFIDGRQVIPLRSAERFVTPQGCKQGTYVAAYTYKGLPFRKVVLITH